MFSSMPCKQTCSLTRERVCDLFQLPLMIQNRCLIIIPIIRTNSSPLCDCKICMHFSNINSVNMNPQIRWVWRAWTMFSAPFSHSKQKIPIFLLWNELFILIYSLVCCRQVQSELFCQERSEFSQSNYDDGGVVQWRFSRLQLQCVRVCEGDGNEICWKCECFCPVSWLGIFLWEHSGRIFSPSPRHRFECSWGMSPTICLQLLLPLSIHLCLTPTDWENDFVFIL